MGNLQNKEYILLQCSKLYICSHKNYCRNIFWTSESNQTEKLDLIKIFFFFFKVLNSVNFSDSGTS